jgi:hypothetical protein
LLKGKRFQHNSKQSFFIENFKGKTQNRKNAEKEKRNTQVDAAVF